MSKSYHPVSIFFHWVIGVAIIVLLGVGLYMADLEPSDPNKWPLYAVHKAVGMTVLFLVALRIVWRGITPPPAPIETQARWERSLAKVVHILLYVGMVVMPVSGYVMSSAGGHAISIFGLFNVPLLVDKNEQIGGMAREAHEIGGNILIAAIVLHFLGAMKHHVLDRDGTLGRMVPFLRKR